MTDAQEILVSTMEEHAPVGSPTQTTPTRISYAVQAYNEANISISPSTSPTTDGQLDSIITAMATAAISDEWLKSKNSTGDGNDSGVETGLTGSSAIALQRALSGNSAGYASSIGGLEVPNGTASCNSSILSFCSDSDGKGNGAKIYATTHLSNDYTSEGGSESSSVSGGPTSGKRSSSHRKISESGGSPKSSAENAVAKSRNRAASASRAIAHSRAISGAPNLATMERARSRDKPIVPAKPPNVGRSASLRRATKPDTLPTGLRDLGSPAVHRVSSLNRTPSITRGRTPATPDDRRWPMMNGQRNGDNIIVGTKYGPMVLDNKSAKSVENYATLPRRRKERSVEDMQRSMRSNSNARDRISITPRRTPSKEASPLKTFPAYGNRGRPSKTKIYHETCVQTAITGSDIEDAFAGKAKNIRVDAVQMVHKESQVDMRDKHIEQLEAKLAKVLQENQGLQSSLSDRNQMLQSLEQQLLREREEKETYKSELHNNTERVMGMLGSVYDKPPPSDGENCDSLLMLESQIQLSGHALEEKQGEIVLLRTICKDLQSEMNRSFTAQKNLLQQKETMEKETNELQDFLQDEKAAIVEALKEAEQEIEVGQKKLEQKEAEIERLRDECRHLVRMSEQRKQEFLGMQTKYTALETRSRDMVVQQGSAISCATSALTGLSTRLNSLVEQLVTSYNISEQELEDLVYHNEVYAMSSEDDSPESEHPQTAVMANTDGSISPLRHQSFIKAVLSAIKSAAITAKGSVNKKTTANADESSMAVTENDVDASDSTDMLDSETEPCLMMENVLEDVTIPDSHSQNMVSSSHNGVSSISHSTVDVPVEPSETAAVSTMNKEEESLFNLCQAIANRQEIEHQTSLMMHRTNGFSADTSIHESMNDMPQVNDGCTAQVLVDHIIEVDNLMTKLLKVLRIIQIEDNDCIQRLIGEKNTLQQTQSEANEQAKDLEMANAKIKVDLDVTSQQLMVNNVELANSRIELQNHRNEIDRLNEDICSLSTLCTQNKTNTTHNVMGILNEWKDRKDMLKPEIVLHVLAACQEIPVLQEMLIKKDQALTELTNSSNSTENCQHSGAIDEVKRQRAAINSAIETLNSIQSIVQQWPTAESTENSCVVANGTSNGDCNANASNNDSVHSTNNSVSESSPNTTIDMSA